MAEPNGQSKRPEDTDFKQQRLKAWQPILTPKWVIASFVVLGVIFIPIGVVILNASNSVEEITTRYDNVDACELKKSNADQDNDLGYGRECEVVLRIRKDMEFPVFIYYQLSSFYQNHRRYVKSRSDQQLRGDTDPSTSGCEPLVKHGGSSKKTLYPCGLIAASYFSDQIKAEFVPRGEDEEPFMMVEDFGKQNANMWKKDGISWKSDRDEKFKLAPYAEDLGSPEFTDKFTRVGPEQERINAEIQRNETLSDEMIAELSVAIPTPDDEDLIVWMRTAGLPNFKKLYRIIEGPLQNADGSGNSYDKLREGDEIKFTIRNYFRVADFSGQKWLVASTTTWLGGKNSFLGYAYIIVGVLCLILAILFFLKHTISPRKLGDMRYFKWHAEDNNRMRRNIS